MRWFRHIVGRGLLPPFCLPIFISGTVKTVPYKYVEKQKRLSRKRQPFLYEDYSISIVSRSFFKFLSSSAVREFTVTFSPPCSAMAVIAFST